MPGKKRVNVDVASLARKHGARAINVLFGIMTNEEVSESERRQAAIALLDRGFGRPQTTTELNVSGEITVKWQK